MTQTTYPGELWIGKFRIYKCRPWTIRPRYENHGWVKSLWFLCFEFNYFSEGNPR